MKHTLFYFLTHPLYTFHAIRMKISDRYSIEQQWKTCMDYPLDLDNPKSACEKYQWLKLHDRNPLYHKLVDKYEVKKYVADRIGEEHVVKAYGVYDSFEQIDFSKLPNQFVIKCTHDSGGYLVCKDKASFNKKEASWFFKNALRKNHYRKFCEWAYKGVRPRLLVEEYIDSLGKLDSIEYKIICIYGKVAVITVCSGIAHTENTLRFNDHYDMHGNKLPFWVEYKPAGKPLPPKEELDEMISVCEKLSEGIPHVRVDLYRHNGQLYFGEFTFYTWAGYMDFHPKKYDRILGDMFELPTRK